MIHNLSHADPDLNPQFGEIRPSVARRNKKLLREALALQHAIITRLGFADPDYDDDFDLVLGYGWGSFVLSCASEDFYTSERSVSEMEPLCMRASSFRPLLDSIWSGVDGPERPPNKAWELIPLSFKTDWYQ